MDNAVYFVQSLIRVDLIDYVVIVFFVSHN